MLLTPKQRRYLRSLVHGRRPVVITGQAGLTPAVVKAIDQALNDHELIKVKLGGGDRRARQAMTEEICRLTGGLWVQNIGRIAVIYRPTSKRIIELPPDGD